MNGRPTSSNSTSTNVVYQKLNPYEVEVETRNLTTDELADCRLAPNEDLYEALRKRNLLEDPSFPTTWGLHLVGDGEIGLSMDSSGKPTFLNKGGRHTLWSPLREFYGVKSITDEVISLGSVQIVTISSDKIGLSNKNGVNIILEPGRYILQKPHIFIKSERINQLYVNLGNHHRLTVPAGHVALPYENGKQILITEDDTKDGPYITNSASFIFDPKAHIKSVQIEDIQLDKVDVVSKELIPLNVTSNIRYKINDPKKAYFGVDDVHKALKTQAQTVLASAFAKIAIEEISQSVSTRSVAALKSKMKGKEIEDIEISEDMMHKATDLFVHEFETIVKDWGVKLENLNIVSIKIIDKTFEDGILFRARSSIEAMTKLLNLDANNQVALKEAEREKQKRIIEAQANAESVRINADAGLYAAQMKKREAEELSSVPLASELATLRAQADIVRAMGNNTVFMPHGISLGNSSIRGQRGQTFWMEQGGNTKELARLETANEVIEEKSRMTLGKGSSSL